MKFSKLFSLLYLLSFLLMPAGLRAVITGNYVSVSKHPFYTFPESPLIIDNEIRGFAWFKNGFALENENTSCVFNAVFPVSGTINLRGGTLSLSEDLIFRNIVDLQGWGTVIGNGYMVDFCSSVTYMPHDADIFDNVVTSIHTDITLSSTLTFVGESTIIGNGNTIFLDTDGGLYIDSDATLLLRDVTIKDISDGNILCADETSKIILDTVNWYQNGSYTFLNGAIEFVDHVGFYGDHTFVYDSSQTSTIKAQATWEIFDDMVFCIGRHSDNGNEPLYMENSNAELRFSNCHLHINEYGIAFTRGRFVFDDIVQLDDDSTSTLNGMMVGDGTAEGDPVLEFAVGASVLLKSSNLVFNTSSPYVIKTGAHKGARLKRFIGSNMYLKTNMTLPSMSLEADSLQIPPIALADGVTLDYDDTLVVLPNTVFDVTSARRNTTTYLLNGGDLISLTKGVFPLNIQVENTNNVISGNGSISGDITLTDENSDVSFALQGFVEGAIVLNSGQVTLTHDLRMGTDSLLSGSGIFDIDDKVLHLPFLDFDWTSSIVLTGNNGSLELHSQVTFQSTMTVVGSVVINGNGNVLDIGDMGHIYIQDSSTLILRDVYINNLKQDKITCIDDSSRIVIDNSFVQLGADCVFEKGSMLFKNNVDVLGNHVFTYESSQTSTVDENSELHVTGGVKFIVNKHTVSGAEPVLLAGENSILHMDNCHMVIENNGAALSKGTLLCDNDVIMEIIGTTTDKGLEVGDGSENDTTKIALNAGATVRTVNGILIYNVGNPNGFVSNSRSSQIIRSPLSNTFMKTAVNLTNITMKLLDTPQLTTPTPQSLSYENVSVDLPGVEFIINGTRYTNSANLLGGDDSIFMIRGTYPMGTVVLGAENIIRGNGAIGGPIILLHPSAEIEWLLNGILIGDMTLNGGTVKLSCDMRLARGTKISNGTINLQSSSLVYGSDSITITQNNYFDGDGGAVEMRADIALDATWTFSQDCIIDGNGNYLTLEDGGEIVVESGSTLRLKNIRIKGIAGTNIRCQDNTARLILDDMYWHQSGDVTYEMGVLEYYNRVEMDADNATSFAYQSCHTSTVHSNARLKLDPSMTFSYDPIFVASKDLLEFEDDSAVLAMRSATLHTTVTGMNLTNGRLDIRGDCHFEAETEEVDLFTMIDEGITIGNQTDSQDMVVEIGVGSQVCVTLGSLNYKNVSINSWVMMNSLSNVHFHSDTTLNLYENLSLGVGHIELKPGVEIKQVVAGKEVIGSILLVD